MHRNATAVEREGGVNNTLRRLLFKAGRGLDQKNSEITFQKHQITALEARIKATKAVAQRRVQADPNDVFIRIEDVVAERARLQRDLEPRDRKSVV